METIERIALETGTSMWGAINETIGQQLLPPRSLSALNNFRELIQDARAMHLGTFRQRVDETSQGKKAVESDADEDLQHSMDFSPAEFESDATEFSADMFGEQSADRTAADDRRSFDSGGQNRAASAQDDNSVGGASSGAGQDDYSAGDASTASSAGAAQDDNSGERASEETPARVEGFRAPGDPASTGELLKFLIDRTSYIKLLEEEDTPESLARIENLRELVNAAMDSRDRGETLAEFLDHAALVSDADQYDENARVTLMTLHAAKGLEFPLVFLIGLEEGLFPHSRTLLVPDDIEEERRLCYVGMTRAMDTLILTRARYRRRYGTDMPEASVPSRFLEEVPQELIQDLGTPRERSQRTSSDYGSSRHYAYEDEDQRPQYGRQKTAQRSNYSGPSYNSIDNIAEFFASRGKKFTRPKVEVPATTGRTGFKPGQRVRHPKYGEGTVYKREGDGEDAKITVQFPRYGLKKLVEKYAQLEKA
jgi:DNA helicase-2/ATP-dependent DNA helicase PcrA